jgi:TonB-dependent starch-binding outer membrane protein SusC
MKKIITYIVVFWCLLLFGTLANAQDLQSVKGVVTSFKTIPLKNVTVTSLKAGESVKTDSTGTFSVKCFKKDVLQVIAYGFIEKKQKVDAGSVYKIDLAYTDNVKNFNEAVSHGHISEKVLKNAVFTKENQNVKDYSKYKSIYDAVASEIYNVRVKGNTIVNTKLRSFDRTPEVLLVVDGKIVSDISFVDTEYIKSIEFIDDVGTAMYGAMGANGVLKITLK